MNEFSPHPPDLFGDVPRGGHDSTLGDKFLVPPFTVLNAREGWWQERKRAWLALGIQSELGRGGQAGMTNASNNAMQLAGGFSPRHGVNNG
jgi:hypothetical protein